VIDEPKKKWHNPKPQRMQRVAQSQDLSQLSRMERCALDWFDRPRTLPTSLKSRVD
jgi:hypothetical protein